MTDRHQQHGQRLLRRWIRGALSASLATLLVGVLTVFVPEPQTDTAEAANAWDFDAGYIISDANFYDSNAMNAGDVQAFLNQHVPTCEPWREAQIGGDASTITCLKNYAMQTLGKGADAYCSGYQSQWQTAAQIIDGVARSCGISQKVLLVMLQKENALVDHTWPSPWRYQTAMGYGCPDGAKCDEDYFGFFNQVYRAAWQYKVYAAKPNDFRYKAGQNNYIQWSPTAACGGSTVYIRNQATASLYNYTPYQPNDAAKNAGYGEGDDCSSYGNRNFFLWYSDWFGNPTGYAVKGAIRDKWLNTATLGAPTSNERPASQGGFTQDFQYGTVAWSPKTGSHVVQNAIRTRWGAIGWVDGVLGYPITDETCTGSASTIWCKQGFQLGEITWQPTTGAQPIKGAIRQKWYTTAGLGFPTESERQPTSRGYAQDFQSGTIAWTPSQGAQSVTGAIRSEWGRNGWAPGWIGYPVHAEQCTWDVGLPHCQQQFDRATITWMSSVGTFRVTGAIQELWYSERGLGYPLQNERRLSFDVYAQDFQGGTITWSPTTGAWATRGALRSLWGSYGWDQGPLGLPISGESYSRTNQLWYQDFQGGRLWSDGKIDLS